MNKIILYVMILFGVMLAGCETAPIKTEVVYVDRLVPIELPEPPVIERPTLVIFTLTPEQEQDDGYVVQAYKLSIKQLQGYAEQLEVLLNGYRKKPQVTPLNPTPALEIVK